MRKYVRQLLQLMPLTEQNDYKGHKDFELTLREYCGDLDAGEDAPDFEGRFVEVFRLRGNLREM